MLHMAAAEITPGCDQDVVWQVFLHVSLQPDEHVEMAAHLHRVGDHAVVVMEILGRERGQQRHFL